MRTTGDISDIKTPDDIDVGTGVWVFLLGWRRGVVRRVIEVNPRIVRRGVPRGNQATVLFYYKSAAKAEVMLSARRRLTELVPIGTETSCELPAAVKRADAVAIAERWWDERNERLT